MVSEFTSDEVLERCLDADVPAVPVLDPSEVSSDPHVVAREAARSNSPNDWEDARPAAGS